MPVFHTWLSHYTFATGFPQPGTKDSPCPVKEPAVFLKWGLRDSQQQSPVRNQWGRRESSIPVWGRKCEDSSWAARTEHPISEPSLLPPHFLFKIFFQTKAAATITTAAWKACQQAQGWKTVWDPCLFLLLALSPHSNCHKIFLPLKTTS